MALACLLPVLVYLPVLDNEILPVHFPHLQWVHETALGDFFTIGDRVPHIVNDRTYVYDIGATPSPYLFTYRPMNYVQQALPLAIAGYNPAWLRLYNLLVYDLETVLVFAIVARLSGPPTVAALTALLYALEPAREQLMYDTTVPIAVFYFATLLLYLLARGARRPLWGRLGWGLSVLCAVVSEFTYELSVTLPLLLLAIEWHQSRVAKRWPSRFLWLLPYFALPVVDFLIRLSLYGGTSGTEMYHLRALLTVQVLEHFATYVFWIFFPNWLDIRRGIKTLFFGGLNGQVILARHPVAVSLLVVVAFSGILFGLWLLTKSEKARRVFSYDGPRGLLWLGGIWAVLTMLPVIPQGGSNHRLILSVVGACLIKAVVIDCLVQSMPGLILRRAAVTALTALLLAYNVATVAPHIQQAELCDGITRGLLRDMQTAVERFPRGRQRVTLYLLNYPGQIGRQSPGSPQGFTEMLRVRLNRPEVVVRVPYSLGYHDVEGYLHALPVSVTPSGSETFVIERPTQTQLPMYLNFPGLESSILRSSAIFSNNGFYTVQVLGMDKTTQEVSRFTLRFHPSPPDETRIVFRYEQGALQAL